LPVLRLIRRRPGLIISSPRQAEGLLDTSDMGIGG